MDIHCFMKHISKPASKFILISLLFVVNYSKGQGVNMKFYNKTGFELDSLLIGKTFIGNLSKDSATDYINYDLFTLDSGIPIINLVALVNNKIITTPKTRRCGTQMKTINEGTYICDIVFIKWGNDDAIDLHPH